jgi:hypothetical protein
VVGGRQEQVGVGVGVGRVVLVVRKVAELRKVALEGWSSLRSNWTRLRQSVPMDWTSRRVPERFGPLRAHQQWKVVSGI